MSATSAEDATVTLNRPRRSLAPDLARGLMLALISIANIAWFLWPFDTSVGTSPHPPARSTADSVVQFVMTIAVDHRAMPLFAFLFGYGMVQFYRSRIDRGIAPRIVRIMLRRRHWAMLLLGFAHAALLFYGDVLGAYAIGALLLVWIFFGRRTRTLRIWALVLLSLMALFAALSLVAGLVLQAVSTPEVLAEMEAGAASSDLGWTRELAYAQPYLISVLFRLLFWLTSVPATGLVAAGIPILLGWIAARRRLLDEPWRHTRLLTRVALAGIGLGVLGGLPDALVNAGALPLHPGVAWTFTGLNYLTGILCGIGYAALFGLLAARIEGRTRDLPRTADDSAPGTSRSADSRSTDSRVDDAALTPAERAYGAPAAGTIPPLGREPGLLARALSAVGQRSLTFYLFQSLIHAPLLAAWGFGLAQHLTTWSSVLLALMTWAISLPIALWMDSRGLRGPAEKLLRRMTYGRHDPSATAPRSRP